MLTQVLFQGIIAYPITPFTAAGAVDLDLYRQLVERLVGSGSHGIAPLGSTGVLPYLTDAERDEVTTATIRQVAGRVPVLVGVSHLTTAGAVRHARFAEQAGASAVMVLPMSYWKLTEAEILRHYEQVARAVAIPLMAYNNPATGGLDMPPALLQRLLQIPNVTMVKESTGDVQRMQALRGLLGEAVAFYNGSNPLALAAFAAGATGWCTAAPNLIPELNLALYEAIQANQLDQAKRLFYRQVELLQFIVAKGLPRAIKAGLELQGLEAGHLRAPLLPLTSNETEELSGILQKTAAPVPTP